MISVDLTAVLIVALVFSLVLVLGRLFFEPLAQTMEERQARIDRAEKIRAETATLVEETLSTHRDAVSKARTEGYEKLDAARTEAETEAQRVLAGAREKAVGELTEARDGVRKQGEQALRELESDADRLAVEIATRILGRRVA